MKTINLLELIPRCHEAAKAKGFWDADRDGGEALMLVVSELGEALEAHRKGRKVTCDPSYFPAILAGLQDTDNMAGLHGVRLMFEEGVKDTPADELADAYIRLCDFFGGFGGPIKETQALLNFSRQDSTFADDLPKNFGSVLFGITSAVCSMEEAIEDHDLDGSIAMAAMAFHHMELLAAREGIDLATHIDLKLRYNATRPVRHGKAY